MTVWESLGDPQALLVVSFYTDRFYQREAYELARSCQNVGVGYRIEQVPDLGGWLNNTNHKPTFLLSQSERYRARALLWLDADARMRAKPDMLKDSRAIVAYHLWRGRFVASGTVYLSASEHRDCFLNAWREEIVKSPEATDQVCLGYAVKAAQIKAEILPYEYCAITDMRPDGRSRPLDPTSKVVIEHTQASRWTRTKESHSGKAHPITKAEVSSPGTGEDPP